ncbi:hypothetical protein [Altericista sp. CCNU0014]|uniref:hypothetical protein n=1 Tax=Altericista sp. CCNU0014 TaxID=3082949 RepID=UPI00384CEA13
MPQHPPTAQFEVVINEMQNTGRNLERLLREEVDSLRVHIPAKMVSRTLRIPLR